MKNNNKYFLLREIIRSGHLWDNETVDFLISKIGKDNIENTIEHKQNIINWSVSSNILGELFIHNYYSFLEGKPLNENCELNLEQWIESLDLKHTQSIKDISFNMVSHSNNKFTVGYLGYLAVKNFDLWFKEYKNSPQKFQLSTQEEQFLLTELFHKEQNSQHFFPKTKDTSYIKYNKLDFFNELILKNKEWLHENDYFSKVFTSDTMKSIITHSDSSFLSNIFSQNDLSIIIKKSHNSKNLSDNPQMLSSLFSISEPKNWIQAYSDEHNNEFNISTFFTPLLRKASGYNKKDIDSFLTNNWSFSQQNKIRSIYSQEEIIKELEYLGPELKDSFDKMTLHDTCVWYANVLISGNRALFETSYKFIPFPDQNLLHEPIIKRFYSNLFNRTKTRDKESWEVVLEKCLAYQLSQELNSHLDNKEQVKKMKI